MEHSLFLKVSFQPLLKGVDIAIMLGGFPHRKGDNKDLFKNVGIYKAQASALEQHVDPNCKVRVYCSVNLLMVKWTCWKVDQNEFKQNE